MGKSWSRYCHRAGHDASLVSVSELRSNFKLIELIAGSVFIKITHSFEMNEFHHWSGHGTSAEMVSQENLSEREQLHTAMRKVPDNFSHHPKQIS